MSDSDRKPRPAEGEPPRTPRADRRQATRYALRDVRAIMSWDEGSEHVTAEGEVLNISGGGAAVLAARAPLAGLSVRLKLECAAGGLEPLEARSLAASADPFGTQLARLQFTRWIELSSLLKHHLERRLWQRFPVRETRARLTWIVDGAEITLACALLNISGGGAALIVSDSPPADESLWLELDTIGKPIDPVESRLVVVSLDLSGLLVARIKFVEPCPRLLFESAVHGFI